MNLCPQCCNAIKDDEKSIDCYHCSVSYHASCSVTCLNCETSLELVVAGNTLPALEKTIDKLAVQYQNEKHIENLLKPSSPLQKHLYHDFLIRYKEKLEKAEPVVLPALLGMTCGVGGFFFLHM